MSSNWLSWLKSKPRDSERAETLALLQRVRRMQSPTPFNEKDKLAEFITDIIFEACERFSTTPGIPLGESLYSTIKELMVRDSLLMDFPEPSILSTLTIEEGVRLRASLKTHERFLSAHERLLPIWREKLVWLFAGMLEYFPVSAFTDIDEHGQAEDDSIVLPEARAFDLCDNLPEVIQRLMATLYDQDISEAYLFQPIRDQINENLCTVSGIRPDAHGDQSGKLVLPTKSRLKEPSALVDAYLQSTHSISSSIDRCRLRFRSLHALSTRIL